MKEKRKFSPTIGLEVHIQLDLKRKMFSPEANTYGEAPNTYTTPTTLAHPGTLPFPNQAAIQAAIIMGIACDSHITKENFFARKHYSYPDLPKSYQITQDKTPICQGGYITLCGPEGEKKIALERIHIEEDTGKSIHVEQKGITLLNFDRAGIPLIELVTKPVLTSPQEVELCLMTIRRLIRYLGVSDGHMERGSLRCDVNISLDMGAKVEVKNLNSGHHAALATSYEINRQKEIIASSKEVESDTRSYDLIENRTIHERKKTGKVDYRYFEDPNLSPFVVTDEQIQKLKDRLPILPHVFYKKLIQTYGLPDADVLIIMEKKDIALFFQSVVSYTKAYKMAANLVIGPLRAYLNKEKKRLSDISLTPEQIANLADMIASDRVSFSVSVVKIFPLLLIDHKADPYQIAKEQKLLQVNDQNELNKWIDEIISKYPEEVEKYRKGKKNLLSFFMGEIMRKSARKANPKETVSILRKKLEEA